jgi:flavin-binding protein dodecin
MRQILLLVSILLLGLTWAVAQDASQTSPSSSQSSASAGQTSSGETSSRRTSAGGETTVEGCLSGSSGSYTLTDKNGNTYQLTGDTAKLSQHVGHEVKITGSSSAGANSGAAAGAAGAAGSQQTLQVASVKHVSKTCQSGGGMSH